jgi:3-deoxy-D-manno-octulosonic acid (KDO) 8-phosphate synthase
MSSWASIDTHSQAYTHHTQILQAPPFLSSQREIMVKFSKQFEGQIVPEWKEAFVDYWQLKKDLKKIHLLNSDTTPTKQQNNSSPNTLFSSLRNFSLFGHHHHRNHEAIHVLFLSLFTNYIYVQLIVYLL